MLLLQRDNKIDLLAIWLERLSAKSITAGQEGLPSALTKKSVWISSTCGGKFRSVVCGGKFMIVC